MNEIESMRYFQDFYDRFADKPGEVYWARVHNQTTREAIETALTALREKLERSNGCVWCKEDNKVFHDGQHFHMFCSYCGKQLEVKQP